jgi:hypothetical protein
VVKVSALIVTRARGVRKRFVTPWPRDFPGGYEPSVVTSADDLSQKMDALGEALRDAGVPEERIASILAKAASASLHALLLEAMVEGDVRLVGAATH